MMCIITHYQDKCKLKKEIGNLINKLFIYRHFKRLVFDIKKVVIKMKKIMLVILTALGLGVFFGYYFFNDLDQGIKKVLSNDDIAYAFQVGVYTNYDNAVEKAEEFISGKVISDEELYRVYIAIVKNEELVDKLRAYYDDAKIDYYVKRINIGGEFWADLNKYEELLLHSNSKIFDTINKEILNLYSEVVV